MFRKTVRNDNYNNNNNKQTWSRLMETILNADWWQCWCDVRAAMLRIRRSLKRRRWRQRAGIAKRNDQLGRTTMTRNCVVNAKQTRLGHRSGTGPRKTTYTMRMDIQEGRTANTRWHLFSTKYVLESWTSAALPANQLTHTGVEGTGQN
jgi:hypothetical protein